MRDVLTSQGLAKKGLMTYKYIISSVDSKTCCCQILLLIENTNREVISVYSLVKERGIWVVQCGVAKDPEFWVTTLCLWVSCSVGLEKKWCPIFLESRIRISTSQNSSV